MSKTKRSLPEDIDVTDPRDTGYDGQPSVPALTDADATDMAIANLFSAVDNVESRVDLERYVGELNAINERVETLIRRSGATPL